MIRWNKIYNIKLLFKLLIKCIIHEMFYLKLYKMIYSNLNDNVSLYIIRLLFGMFFDKISHFRNICLIRLK